ncbi:MAG: hypothetical protein FJW40_06955 [Acidobacteria bacterium]|nr:hypothetical protein [Acidobacteriota bacterium]
MTKCQIQFELSRPVDDAAAAAIARLHSVYGIASARLSPRLDVLTVEYDATRMNDVQAERTLAGLGISARRK